METIVLNMGGSTINLNHESMMLRLALLLSDTVFTAGEAYQMIHFDDAFNASSVTDKLTVLKAFREETRAEYEEMISLYKNLAKRKSKTKDDVVWMKRVEKNVAALFEEHKNQLRKTLDKSGLRELARFRDCDDFLCLPVDNDQRESGNGPFYALSKIITGEWLTGYKDPDDKFSYPIQFLSPEFFKEDVNHQYPIEEGQQPIGLYPETCFSISNVNLLNGNELLLLRNQLAEGRVEWQVKANEWIRMVHDNKPEEARKFFVKEVLPSGSRLRNDLEKNELLEYAVQMNPTGKNIEVRLGALPVSRVWDYYRRFGVGKEDTWKVIDEGNHEALLKQWCPVISISAAAGNDEENENSFAADAKPLKKHLEID